MGNGDEVSAQEFSNQMVEAVENLIVKVENHLPAERKIPGEIIKSSIVWKNDEGKNTFSMTREVLSAVFSDFNSSEFKISNKFKKVSELD